MRVGTVARAPVAAGSAGCRRRSSRASEHDQREHEAGEPDARRRSCSTMTSSPMIRNSTAFRISSISSQKVSRCCTVRVAHRVAPAVVADHQAGDDDGDRGGEVQPGRRRRPAGDQGQGQQDLHLIVVDPLEHLHHHPARRRTRTAPRRTPPARTAPPMCPASNGSPFDGHAEDGEEDDDRDAVVEQRLAGDLDLQRSCSPPAVFRMPITAIGSVGEISEPNSRQ